MSPDPAGLAAVDLASPQPLNGYSYVANVPLASIDPFGLKTDREDVGWCLAANQVAFPEH